MDPAQYHFNPFALPPLITAVLLGLITAWVLIRERASAVSRALAMSAVVIFVWLITNTLMYLSTSPELAMFCARLGCLGVPLIGPAMYYFSTRLLGVSEKRRLISAVGWAVGLVFSV